MIDTIHIELSRAVVPSLRIHQAFIDADTGELKHEIGYAGCIKVKKYSHVIRIECSLPKLLSGSNIFFLSYAEILKSIEKIEQILEVSLRDGIIRRIDHFVNISTNYTPSSYFRYLGNVRYLTRIPVGKTSLYYKNDVRELCFYDKIAEIKSCNNDESIPQNVAHLLRIEYKLRNTVLKKLFGRVIRVTDLYNKNIVIKLIRELYRAYVVIFKDAKPSLEAMSINSHKIFVQQLASLGIESCGGSSKVLEMIENTRLKFPDLPSEYISRRKREVRNMTKIMGITKDHESIIELDTKVTEACNTLIKSVEMVSDENFPHNFSVCENVNGL